MSVVYSTELWSGRGGKNAITRKRSHVKTFEVRTTTPSDDDTVVAAGVGVSLGDVHPNDAGSFCTDVDPSQSEDDPTLWNVVCTYDTKIEIQQNISIDVNGNASVGEPYLLAEDPTDRPPVFKFSFVQKPKILRQVTQTANMSTSGNGTVVNNISGGLSIQADVVRDPDGGIASATVLYDSTVNTDPFHIAGFPPGMGQGVFFGDSTGPGTALAYTTFDVTNTAGDPMDPPVEIEEAQLQITITKNVPIANFTVPSIQRLINTVNNAQWIGLGERTCRVTGLEVQSRTENSYVFFELSATITHNPDQWDIAFQDRGFNQWIGTELSPPTGKKKIVDNSGREPTTNGYALDGTGTPLGGNSGGSGATATATVTAGVVTAIAVTAGGTGYTGGATVAIQGGGGVATAEATVVAGVVTAIAVTNGGDGYADAEVSISGVENSLRYLVYRRYAEIDFGGVIT